jgi:hypothetical protein
MKLVTLAFLATTLTAGVALAQSPADTIIANMGNLGYTNIQVETQGLTYQVTATKNGQVRELVYDAQSGQLLSDRIDANGDGQVDMASEHSGSNDHSNANDNSDNSSNDNGTDDSASNDHGNNDKSNDRNNNNNDRESGNDRENDNGRDND